MNQPDHFLWVEKYRPTKIDETIIPEALKTSLKKYIEQGQITNMLFFSPSPGTGKTTAAKAICAELGITPLFINASLENSIDDIRMKVVAYATTASLLGDSVKVVILDEANRLSSQAQDSLKGLVEHVSANCRFILTSNSKVGIIEPLRSRCTEVDFVYSKDETVALGTKMLKRCLGILEQEGVTADVKVVAAVVRKYMPDNRKILSVLQQYASENGNTIDSGVLGKLQGADQSVMIEAMRTKSFDVVKSWCFDNSDRLNDEFYLRLYKTLDEILVPQSVPQAALIINDYQRHHSVVPDKFIHFLALCVELMMNVQFR